MKKILTFLYSLSSIKWRIIYFALFVHRSNFRRAMLHNRILHNIHKGERCFIVGNGPSINELDLGKLKNECVFTVNNITNDKSLFKNTYSSNHVFIDPIYEKESSKELESFFNSISSTKKDKINIFCTWKILNKVRLVNCNNKCSFYYLFLHDNWNSLLTRNIDLSRNLPTAQNVVQAAIYIALYMGFKEIYLIGCEMSSFLVNLEYNANNVFVKHHAYNLSDEERKNFIDNAYLMDNEFMLGDTEKAFYIFKKINNYAKSNGVQIINSTSGGFLDMFERKDFNTLFN